MTKPKSIKDYIFYKIFCVDKSVELSYIGSTSNWKQRNRSHKSDCYNQKRPAYNYKVYKTIRANGGWSNFKMIEIGNKEQITKRQAEQIEEQYRLELNTEMNGQRCFITEEQKKEETIERGKKYAQTDKAKASQALANKKYLAKKKLEKEQLIKH